VKQGFEKITKSNIDYNKTVFNAIGIMKQIEEKD
jgi:hypothetical protein